MKIQIYFDIWNGFAWTKQYILNLSGCHIHGPFSIARPNIDIGAFFQQQLYDLFVPFLAGRK